MQLRVASLKTQKYRHVPLMANHSLSKMLITLPSHSVGLVIRIISFERGIWLAVKPFRGLLGPARLIIAGKEQMR